MSNRFFLEEGNGRMDREKYETFHHRCETLGLDESLENFKILYQDGRVSKEDFCHGSPWHMCNLHLQGIRKKTMKVGTFGDSREGDTPMKCGC